MGLHALGGGLLVVWLALQPAWAEPTTVLFLAHGEPLFSQMWGFPLRPSETRSAPLSIRTPTGETLHGFIVTTTQRKVPAANNSAALTELCRRDRADVVIAFGREAAQTAALEYALPLLMVQVSGPQVASLLAQARHNSLSAIYLEAEPLLNLRVLRVLLPVARTVGVLVPTPAPAWLSPLRAEAQRLHFTLDEITATADLDAVRALRPRLPGLDAVLLPPEPALINEWSLKPLLLMTVRQGVPTFGGLTARYVEAGVLAAVVADEERLPEQIQAVVAGLARGRAPAPTYPTAVRVVVNPIVAQTLGLSAEVVDRARSLLPRSSSWLP